jgi:transposase
MRAVEKAHAPADFLVDLGAIFVSMELSKSTWPVTSFSPGAGDNDVNACCACR